MILTNQSTDTQTMRSPAAKEKALCIEKVDDICIALAGILLNPDGGCCDPMSSGRIRIDFFRQ